MKILRNRIRAKNLPIIWLEGSDGSGKQSHACNIAERFGYNHIQVERMLKKEAEKSTRRGRYIKAKILTQRKIPDVRSQSTLHFILYCSVDHLLNQQRLVIELIKERMVSVPDCNGFLVSGFPQNPKQASYFVREVAPVDCILYLEGEPIEGTPLERSVGDHAPNIPTPDISKTASGARIVAGKYDVILERVSRPHPYLHTHSQLRSRSTPTSPRPTCSSRSRRPSSTGRRQDSASPADPTSLSTHTVAATSTHFRQMTSFINYSSNNNNNQFA